MLINILLLLTMKEQALKVLSDHANPREIRAAALREITAEAVAALPPLPEPAVRQDKPPLTRSSGAGRSIVDKPLSAATVAEMLSYIPPPTEGPGEYSRWLRHVSSVAATLSPGEALKVLLEWSPDRVPGETADKIRNRLTGVKTGTLVYDAKAAGWPGTHPETNVLRVTRENEDGEKVDEYLLPQPFSKPRLNAVLPYRATLLPPDLRDWVIDMVDRSGFQEDFVVVTALCALGICLGSKVAVYPKRQDDWHEHANLWGMLVGKPGSMKSPAMTAALDPLRAIAAKWNENYQSEMAEFAQEKTVAAIENKVAKKNAQTLAYKGKPFDPFQEKAMDPPQAKRLFTSDATKEKLASLMKENPAGILGEYDELMGLISATEADPGYKEFLLKCWSGKSSHYVDRIGRGSEFIPRACASVLGGIQPGRLRPLVAAGLDGGKGSDGFLARFQLLAWPDPPIGNFVMVDRYPNTDARTKAQAVFETLANMQGCEFPSVNANPTPGLRYDDDAQNLFYVWYTDLENRLRADTEPDAMLELLNKTRKLVPALSLILQLGRDPKSQTIDLEALENAIELSLIAESHQRRLHAYANEDVNVAHLIWQKLLDGSLDQAGFSARDVLRPNWSGLTDAAIVKVAVEALEDKYWICRLEQVPGGGKGGRPTTRYYVNPEAKQAEFFA